MRRCLKSVDEHNDAFVKMGHCPSCLRRSLRTINPNESDDDLWKEVGKIVMDGYEFSNEEVVTILLKSKYGIYRKITNG